MLQPGSDQIGRKTAVAAGWMVAWRMAARTLGFISMLFLARLLVPADFGLVAMAAVFNGTIEALSLLGVDSALVRSDDIDDSLLNTAFTMEVIRALTNAAVVALLSPLASAWFDEPRLLPILLVLAANAAVGGFENIGVVSFRREMRFEKEFLVFLLPRVGGFVVTLVLALLLRSYWALVAGIVLTQAIRLVLTYVIHPYRPRFSLARWRDLTGFSFWMWVYAVASFLGGQADTLVLGHAFGPAVLGIYLTALQIGTLPITEVTEPIRRALFSGFSAAHRRGANPIVNVVAIASVLLLGIVPVAIGISAAAGPITAILLGPRWHAASPLIAIFALQCVFSVFSSVLIPAYVARANVRSNALICILTSISRFAAMYLGAVSGSLAIAAWASVVSRAFEMMLYFMDLRRSPDFRISSVLVATGRILVAGAISAAVLYASGLAWMGAPASTLAGLRDGALIGALTLTSFAAVQIGLWMKAGCPGGPERRVWGSLMALSAPLRLKVWLR